MTIKQYKKIAATIANRIIELGGDPAKVRNLKAISTFEVGARDPKNKDRRLTLESGDENMVIYFDCISNPNNPNYKFKTLKPGSISLYDSKNDVNVDPTEYNFDSAQFADLMDAIRTSQWKIFR